MDEEKEIKQVAVLRPKDYHFDFSLKIGDTVHFNPDIHKVIRQALVEAVYRCPTEFEKEGAAFLLNTIAYLREKGIEEFINPYIYTADMINIMQKNPELTVTELIDDGKYVRLNPRDSRESFIFPSTLITKLDLTFWDLDETDEEATTLDTINELFK